MRWSSGCAPDSVASRVDHGARRTARRLPPDRLLLDPDVQSAYLHDEAVWAEHGRPLAVVRPASTAEVAAVVAVCARHRRAGRAARRRHRALRRGQRRRRLRGALAPSACATIVEINPAERLAVVQPGVVNDDLRAAAAEQGLWYPPDPASAPWSTIGGNVATNAGGLCCVKYGVTRDYVLALEVVTAAGEVVRLGGAPPRAWRGTTWSGCMVGSEGTLGVITEVTVRLRPLRTDRAAHGRRVLRHPRRRPATRWPG